MLWLHLGNTLVNQIENTLMLLQNFSEKEGHKRASVSAENMTRFNFDQPESLYLVSQAPENWITTSLKIPWVNAFLLLLLNLFNYSFHLGLSWDIKMIFWKEFLDFIKGESRRRAARLLHQTHKPDLFLGPSLSYRLLIWFSFLQYDVGLSEAADLVWYITLKN